MIHSAYPFMRTRRAKTHVRTHAHTQYEFVYFFSGKGVLEINNTTFNFGTGSYYITQPNVEHSELHENTGLSLVLRFNIPENFAVKTIAQYDINLNLSVICTQMRQEMKDRLYRNDLIIDSLISQIVVFIARQQNTKVHDLRYALESTINYIDEYYMTDIKVGELATECGYTPDHFRVLFKKATKQNPKDYILSKRLKLAKKYLKTSDIHIAEICARCGFEYYSQFMSFFKRKIGMTPSEYRNLKR